MYVSQLRTSSHVTICLCLSSRLASAAAASGGLVEAVDSRLVLILYMRVCAVIVHHRVRLRSALALARYLFGSLRLLARAALALARIGWGVRAL